MAADGRTTTLAERLMADVCEHIRQNGLAPGGILPSEAEFATRAGVSRTVAREGFRGLAALKLIDVSNGRRARVAQTDDSVLGMIIDHSVHTRQVSIQQILDVRRTIELRTAALAALRRSEREAGDIVALSVAMRESVDDADREMETDIAFHEAIGKACRNPLFTLLVGSFRVVTRQTWPIGWASRLKDGSRLASIDCHAEIAAAIRERNSLAAEKAMAEHFDSTVKTLLNAGVV